MILSRGTFLVHGWLSIFVITVVFTLAVESDGCAESLLSTLLKFSGIAASPSQQKSLDDILIGDIWIVNLNDGSSRPITNTGLYRSPVFHPDNTKVLSLTGSHLVEVDLTRGEIVEKPYALAGVIKLVSAKKDADSVLVVTDMSSQPTPALLSIATGKITPLAYDSSSPQDLHLIYHLEQWERTYDDVTLYVKTESKRALGGIKEWTDVYLKQGDAPPLNLTRCNGMNCGQPSLSQDRSQVVFIKSR